MEGKGYPRTSRTSRTREGRMIHEGTKDTKTEVKECASREAPKPTFRDNLRVLCAFVVGSSPRPFVKFVRFVAQPSLTRHQARAAFGGDLQAQEAAQFAGAFFVGDVGGAFAAEARRAVGGQGFDDEMDAVA